MQKAYGGGRTTNQKYVKGILRFTLLMQGFSSDEIDGISLSDMQLIQTLLPEWEKRQSLIVAHGVGMAFGGKK